MVLLEAEKLYTMGNIDQASLFYERAIRLAHEHKFVNDEAIASELAGMFFFERELHEKTKTLLLHSVQCYKTWGALAVAKRVETFVTNKYGTDLRQKPNYIVSVLASNDESSKKRKE